MVYKYYGDELYHHGILGMKWGVRRYQNKDGTLTDAGKKRYNRDVQENLAKKKENRIDTSNPDPDRWVKEDLQRSIDLTNTSSKLVNQMQNIEKETTPKKKKERMDLSNMTDKEMRDKINRELLEQQYDRLFNDTPTEEVSKGRTYAREALNDVGTVLALAGTSLTLALTIKQLKG